MLLYYIKETESYKFIMKKTTENSSLHFRLS